MCFKWHYSYSSKHGLRAWRWPVTKASAASDENLLKVTTFPFQLSSCQHRLWHWSIPATPHVTGHTNILKLNKYIYFIYTYKMLICTAYPSECKGGHQESFNFCHGTSSRLYISWPQCLCAIVVSVTTVTHWSRVTHICVSNLTIIGSANGLSPGRRQSIIWTNAGILLIEPLGQTSVKC